MEKLKLLEKLKELADKLGDDSDEEKSSKKKENENEAEKKMPSTLRLLYAASKLRIYKLADKVASNEVSADMKLFEESKVEIPVAEMWHFSLGDMVRIKYSFSDFKSIQCRTLGWNAKLRTIYGCTAIVTKRLSPFENSVTLYTPSRLATSSLYAGLLEKISDTEEEKQKTFSTRWKVGEYVTTIMDLKVVELMQRRLDTIPRRYLGRKGRIIAITRVAIIVTFNEKTSYDVNSYLLVRCPDQSPLDITERKHDKGFRIGEKVRMNGDVRQLIKNQKRNGGWSEDMTKLVGKEVRIIHIHKDGKLKVQYRLGRSWVINADSVSSLLNIEKMKDERNTDFLPGDIVKIRLMSNMRAHLQKKNVPFIFLDYLRSTAEVKLIDDDFDYLIRYNCDQNIAAYAPTLRKATTEEITHHIQIKSMVNEMSVNSKVVLDVGPPNYVKYVLKESMASPDVVHALTTPATLVGFADDRRAVIEYESGKRYKIKKKFLTVPEKFNMQGSFDGMDYSTAKEIQESIASCVQMLREDDSSYKEGIVSPIKILSISFGSPPAIDLRVQSTGATTERICELLITVYGWDVEIEFDNQFRVKGLESFDPEIQINLFFNEELYTYRTCHAIPALSSQTKKTHTGGQKEEVTEVIEECPAASGGAGPIPDARQAPGVQVEEPFEGPARRPASIDEFKFLCLKDRSLSRNVYIPFYISGEQRRMTPAGDNVHPEHDRISDISSGKYNVFNIDRVDKLNINN